MTDTAIKNAKTCVVQLLITEAVSVGFFFRSIHFIYIGIMAPVAVFFFPVWAFKDGNYSASLVCLLADIVFLSLMTFLFVKDQKLVARAILLVVNVASVILVLDSI